MRFADCLVSTVFLYCQHKFAVKTVGTISFVKRNGNGSGAGCICRSKLVAAASQIILVGRLLEHIHLAIGSFCTATAV